MKNYFTMRGGGRGSGVDLTFGYIPVKPCQLMIFQDEYKK